jgi:hypothetical protein
MAVSPAFSDFNESGINNNFLPIFFRQITRQQAFHGGTR